MIIFDTNAVNLLPPEGPRADIIRKLRQSKHHRVAVPWMVLEEMAAHKAIFYPEKHRSVMSALEKLRDVLPWELASSLEPLDVERFLEHWRGVYGKIFEVIETSGEAARKALAREAMALPPAKRAKDHSEGARDVAIWFSILEFLRQNPEEHVCFVTANTADFGDGTAYPHPMNEDVRGLEDRLTRLQDFDQVVSQFTKEVSGKDAEAAAGQLLRSLTIRERVAQTAVEVLSSPSGFVGLGAADAAVEWREWLASPEVELVSVTDVTGHEIESDVWYTANVRWLLYGLALNGDEPDARYIACVWPMKVLFSATEGDETPTLLATQEPSSPDTGDEPCMKILRGLKQRVRDLVSDAKNLAAAQSPERLAAEQLSSLLPKLDLATSHIARQFAATQALFDNPVQRLAQKMAADHAAMGAVIDSSMTRVARKLAADQAALAAAINGPVYRLAQQLAADRAARTALFDSPAHRFAQQIAGSRPKLDIATAVPQSSAGEHVPEDDLAQVESSDIQDGPEGETDGSDADDGDHGG